MIQYISGFFKSLNANSHPGDIAHATALGLVLALMPKNNALWIIVFCISLFVRMNKGAFFISLILLSFITPFADVAIERIGNACLSAGFMRPVYAGLDNIPFVGWTKFNNTMVMGGFVAGFILYVPCYMLTRFVVKKYRAKINTGIMRKISAFMSKIPLAGKISSFFEKGE